MGAQKRLHMDSSATVSMSFRPFELEPAQFVTPNGESQVMAKRTSKSLMVRLCARMYMVQGRWTVPLMLPLLRSLAIGRAYGRHLQDITRRYGARNQSHATFFLRNRPELELMRRLLDSKPNGARVDIAIVACSKGAEVYSIVWKLRSARPDLQLKVNAIDISREIVDFAGSGVYSMKLPSAAAPGSSDTNDLTWKDQVVGNRPLSMFERMTSEEINEMFEFGNGQAKVKSWLREGITWQRGDATDPKFAAALGAHDIVVANRFLCHMQPPAAEACLRNIAGLVKASGYLFVSGVDLDVRTKVACELGWRPVTEMIREVHEGDSSLLQGWPMNYWALEPFCDRTPDWAVRYASVFKIGELS
jgi:chemotaxis methyl-accepting protein methylase